jgi:hypothetical protein
MLIMKCRKHSSYGMKLFIPQDECFFFSFLTMKSSIAFGTVNLYSLSYMYCTDVLYISLISVCLKNKITLG